MPERIAVITALITERPLCLACTATRAMVTPDEVSVVLQRLARILPLNQSQDGRCRACGTPGPVVSVDRPGQPSG